MATVKYVELMRVYAMVIPFLILLMAGSLMVACRRVTPCVLSTTIIGLVTCTERISQDILDHPCAGNFPHPGEQHADIELPGGYSA